LREAGESSKTRMENASWIGESNDERLTLVTCWPYESNTHRLIVVARPVNVLNSR
jgi:LPXTG-site transpeptidase (sortase) family protein